ncbi:phosphoglucosamine mutase [Desulfonispora thiosulfatigenes DSM 11270]|uniref:Phosphoglucosamine mutase n=1 Tax=Desulfonispora thiosulfatigenes DSM 11270 TaxID=656914 RepID=A0A1W1V8J6_DESTI|nr:phosphoglucosamine mutase [Desulfonispora thiosulfatigenes]SMB89563.1 phosphoglucosamine mutase [Desulfonispora thiosulfatigenes DSM 11270]
MSKIFGTDGVRGCANVDLTPQLAYELGRAAAFVLKNKTDKKTITIGKDTRRSGDMLEAALISGICSVGIDVYKLGVMPTPAIAYLTRKLDAMSGVVISASHNPAEDNGIKFFSHEGFKLPDEVESEIEALIASGLEGIPNPKGSEVGIVNYIHDGEKQYLNFLKTEIPVDLTGLKIVVDCANGAASNITPRLLESLGAEVISLYSSPDGMNINANCGSTYPENLQEAVLKHGADIGIAHDGDADRMLAVDEKGNLVDGDQILVICALDMKKEGKLKGNKIVVTVMSNLGLKQAFEKHDVEVIETKVGDRYVLEKMQELDASLGGEQSGHLIFLDHNTTGDGVLSALKLLEVINKSKKPFSELAVQMTKLPQVLVNVRVKSTLGWDVNPTIKGAINKYETELGSRGRILVRASGTEPLIRVMLEGNDYQELENIAGHMSTIINQEIN